MGPHNKEEDLLRTVQEKLPNLPLLYWQENKERNFSSPCDDIPDVLGLDYNNDYWQIKKTPHNTLFLYAAYFDNRQVILVRSKLSLRRSLIKINFDIKLKKDKMMTTQSRTDRQNTICGGGQAVG